VHADYADITSRIVESPTWYDEHGVPRYGAYGPDASPNIYADQVAFLRIRCQDCGRQFVVEMSGGNWDRIRNRPLLDERVRDGSIHYGDPPRHDCRGAGDTMNSIPERVLEFWKQTHALVEWERVPELEVEIKYEWAEG